jgi:hypothetical protein
MSWCFDQADQCMYSPLPGFDSRSRLQPLIDVYIGKGLITFSGGVDELTAPDRQKPPAAALTAFGCPRHQQRFSSSGTLGISIGSFSGTPGMSALVPENAGNKSRQARRTGWTTLCGSMRR